MIDREELAKQLHQARNEGIRALYADTTAEAWDSMDPSSRSVWLVAADVMAASDHFTELERLRRWKEESMVVLSGLQDVGRALDLPLGARITGPLAVEAVNRLRAERDNALKEQEA